MMQPMLIHLSHSSVHVPLDIRKDILLSDAELEREMLMLTDRYTDQLFLCPEAEVHKNEFNRIVFDPERFRSDKDEEMARVGMGAICTSTIYGKPLREITQNRWEELMQQLYDPYHAELERKTARLLDQFGKCLIVDGHSFPQVPLPFELDQSPDRPDICVGTCDFHTPRELCDLIVGYVKNNGMTVKLNSPFAGTMVIRVSSVMIEINRRLYMDETTGHKNSAFDEVRVFIDTLLDLIIRSFNGINSYSSSSRP